jgi:DNA-binding transcriptional MerR regulator
MIPNDQTPTYNLKAVVRETGLKPDTLRAWERRYELPQPRRTAGGHRLYSQRDIETLKWLVARQSEGLSISRAVDLWRQLESDSQDPLQPALPEVKVTPFSGEAISDLRQGWIAACLDFNEPQADHIFTEAFALYSPEIVCLELMMKGLARIGQGWYDGEITVQQEHFAASLVIRRLEALLAAAPAPTRSERLLVGCPPGEEHIFGPLLITFLLRRRGWGVIYLGANVPLDHMAETIEAAKPSLVILSAQQLPTAVSLMEMARNLYATQVPVGYGGRIFSLLPGLRSRIVGHYLGDDLEQVPLTVDRLLTSQAAVSPVDDISDAYKQALDSYREHRLAIENSVWQTTAGTELSPRYFTMANANIARYVTSALRLGDMSFLGADIEWVEGLLVKHNELPSELLRQYLYEYRQATGTHLNSRGKPIVDWFDQLQPSAER